MRRARPADHINQMPFETWLCAESSAQTIGLAPAEIGSVLRWGRRNGMLTVRRENGTVEFMRIRRHPAQTKSRTTTVRP